MLMVETKEKQEKSDFVLDADQMTRAGLHFGHKTSAIHPKMRPYISGSRNNVHIIDIEKTKEKLTRALEFVRELISEKKALLLVGTKIQMKDLVKETAEACGIPYINERWLGGTFTNFETILKRIEYYKDLETQTASGELEKYTKKEKAKINREIKTLEVKFKGLKDLGKLPDAVFVCDMRKDKLAVKEAKMKMIKVISICDTNVDPSSVDFPIPANDDAISSVKYILDKLIEVYAKHRPDKKTS